MEVQYSELPLNKIEELKSKHDPPNDLQMTASVISVTSSLTSPVDSGVQLLDSESEIASVMSMSGTGDLDEIKKDLIDVKENFENFENLSIPYQHNEMTKSDIANSNISPMYETVMYSSSAPLESELKNMKNEINFDEKQDSSKDEIQNNNVSEEKSDVIVPEMHVSMSEEVKESGVPTAFTLPPDPVPNTTDEQIVYRRQRKKRSSKSDTPKKRVSFHEDILNSTRTNDIHIEHGFITQPDISVSFFNWDSIRKKDVVKGRYSWAAEGDTPYYHNPGENEDTRQVHSEMYVKENRWSVTSSSSDSFDSGSSNSLNENEGEDNPVVKPKAPRSSCLKKRSTKRIETCIVQENTIGSSSPRNRRSDSNLLDSNIFGSLKNILSLSTSVPLAERGVPEGQEDVSMCSSSQDRRKSSLGNTKEGWFSKSLDHQEKTPEAPRRNSAVFVEPARNHLKLVPTEIVPADTANIVLCDSTVYEHKGISYSYEYDKFQKSFETQANTHKPKSSTIYQLLLRDLNFFKKREKELSENNLKELCSSPLPGSPKDSTPSKSDWSSDTTETVSDLCEVPQKHLASPKHKVKPNHYSVQNFKPEEKDDQSFKIIRPASSKTSLINRFLRNVTMKKLLDAKLQKKQKSINNSQMGLYMKGVRVDHQLCRDVDRELEEEIVRGKKTTTPIEIKLGSNYVLKLKKDVFRDSSEKLVGLYKVKSIYSNFGESKPLIIILTDCTLYITGLKQNHSMSNQFVLPYSELNTILVGPDSHILHFSNIDHEMQYFVVTGSSDITGELVGCLEMTMRNEKKLELPAVRHLTMREMARLRYDICQQTDVNKDEEYFHYSIVNIQEASNEPASTPLGPTKEGPLMFKTATDVRWQTGYFILKGGVLYMLSSPSNRVPMRALPLSGGACVGAHRTPYLLRPHTFELLLGTITLQLAAPDEYVASDWLQVLVQAASGLYGINELYHAQSCTLLITNAHILTMREAFPGNRNINVISDDGNELKAKTLSCATISDITAIRIPLAEQSWCILEFACREVHETSGDLVVYFATNTELERFLSTLEILWSYNNRKGDSFPLNTICEGEPVNQKYSDMHRTLQTSWSSLIAPNVD